MAKWWKFGLGKKGQEQGPAPEQAPAPTPAPAPQAPEPAAGTGEKKRGLLGRLADRVTGKGKKEKAPAAPPEAPPAAPPAAPSPPPAAPPSAPAGGGEVGEGGGAGPVAPDKERSFPSSIDAEADGDWVISQNEWYGQMEATLTGNKAKAFILAYEANDWTECAQLIADGWNMPVASQIDTAASTIENVTWN